MYRWSVSMYRWSMSRWSVSMYLHIGYDMLWYFQKQEW
jgi:hypothetical protein